MPEVELRRAMLSRNCIVAYPLLALTDDAVVVINTSRRGEISRSAVVAEANCWALFIIQEFIPSIAWTRRVLMSLCRDGSVAEKSRWVTEVEAAVDLVVSLLQLAGHLLCRDLRTSFPLLCSNWNESW